ncbi:RNA polymerase sigma factor [Pontiellaceae bacterium B12227]|nr:RNA polymerase sigma factor [Pontiellaceae bacterium B12227]
MSEFNPAEAHYQSLYRFALSLARHPYDAEDLVHQTYLKWMKNRDKIRDKAKTKSWLFTTLHREFLHGQKSKARQTLVEADQLDRVAEKPGPDAGNKLDAEYAMNLMQQVPEPYRASLSLFYVQDFSYREIAEVLEIAPGTVMSRIYRGKQILKDLMVTWKQSSKTQPQAGAE